MALNSNKPTAPFTMNPNNTHLITRSNKLLFLFKVRSSKISIQLAAAIQYDNDQRISQLLVSISYEKDNVRPLLSLIS